MNPAQKFIKYISGKNLQELQQAGINQQRKVRDYPYLNKNILRREDYRNEVDKLKDLDQEYSRQSRNLVLARTGVALPVAYGGAKFLEKNGSSRLLQILKGTRKNELTKQVKKLETEFGKRSRRPGFEAISDKDINKLQKLKKDSFKEKFLTWGTRGLAVGLPAILAKNQFEKKAARSAASILPYTVGLGTAGGVGRVLVDKNVENNAENLLTTGGIGAGVGLASGGLAGLFLKYPHLRNWARQKSLVKI